MASPWLDAETAIINDNLDMIAVQILDFLYNKAFSLLHIANETDIKLYPPQRVRLIEVTPEDRDKRWISISMPGACVLLFPDRANVRFDENLMVVRSERYTWIFVITGEVDPIVRHLAPPTLEWTSSESAGNNR